jgi:hypothetical protein
MYRRFASLSHASEFGYAYDSGVYDSRAPLEAHFRMFQTYGDALTQHSGDWGVTIEHLADYLASLAEVAINDDELLDRIKLTVCNRPTDREIAFAFTVVHKPEMIWYVNMKESKVSRSSNKEHDKRWVRIEEWMNGSPLATYRLLTPDWANGMMKYSYASALHDWCYGDGDRPHCQQAAGLLNWFKDDPDKQNKSQALYNAYEACYCLAEAYVKRERAKTLLESYKRRMNIPIVEKVDG